MGFRFRKSVRILPGVRLNFSGSGVSTSIGPRGATINLGRRGIKSTTSIPGSGLSYTQQLAGPTHGRKAQAGLWLGGLAAVGAVVGLSSGSDDRPGPVQSIAPAAAAPLTSTMYVTASSLNCRAAPEAKADVIFKLPRNSAVAAEETTGEWTKVYRTEGQCWGASRYLSNSMAVQPVAAFVASRPERAYRSSSRRSYNVSCPCSGGSVCIGPRGGRYCITSGGNKRYGV